MINFYGFSNLFGTITNLAIAIFVYAKGGGSKLSRIWSIFTFCVAIYGFGAYMASGANNYDSAFLWWQISYVGVILLPVLFMHFVYTFLKIKRAMFLRSIYLLTSIIWLANLFSKDLFIGHVTVLFNNSRLFSPAWWVYPPGPMHIFYVFFLYVGLLGYVLYELIRSYGTVDALKRKQIKYFFIAMMAGFLGGGTSFLPCFGIQVYPVLNITVPLYTLIIAYAIIRHQLMDIEVIIKRTLVFAGLFIASYAVFASFAYLGSVVFENVVRNRWIALIPSVFIIVLMLRPLEILLRSTTDKYLFQKKYDYRKLLRTFSEEVLTVLDLEMLVNLTVNNLVEIIKLENASILLCGDEGTGIRLVASAGDFDPEDELDGSEDLVAYMQKQRGYILREEVVQKNESISKLRKKMNELRVNMMVPLIHQRDMIGVLTLGKKKSDEEFNQDDIDILLPLANTLSIAITNAQLFEQLSEAQAQAAQREKMAVIGTLSAGINHEICNPLGIARGQCEMFLLNLQEGIYKDKSLEELLEKAQDIMNKVINETDRATVITRKLSSFAKPAKGELKDDVDVKEEIEKVIALVEHDLKLDNILVEKHIQDNMPDIAADAKQIQEIFFNVIRNAAQSIRGDGKVIIRTSSDNRNVYVDIEDTGTGINKKHLDQIFNPFFTTKEPGEGTGLGLFIVKQIIERNNGSISVRSEPDKGTVFRLVFSAAGSEKSVEVSSLDAERMK